MNTHTNILSVWDRLLASLLLFGVLFFGSIPSLAVHTAGATNTPVLQGPACGFEERDGRYIAHFPSEKIRSDKKSEDYARTDVMPFSIPSGLYDVTLVSYDGYADRVDVTQPRESWVALLRSSGVTVAETLASDDLADEVAEATNATLVNTDFFVPEGVDGIKAYHASYPDPDRNPNSIYPVCAVFDRIADTEEEPNPPVEEEPEGPGSGPLGECEDAIDNDFDNKIDENDPGCHTDGDADNPESYDPSDATENQKPVITLLGDNPLTVIKGETFTDPGATALDPEDGDITANIIVGGDTVETDTLRDYTIRYDVSDSMNTSADQVTRTVTVVEPECTNCGGSESPEPAPATPPATTGGGGGGGGGGNTPTLTITNEKVERVNDSDARVTWNTNRQSTSIVAYGDNSVVSATGINYGYDMSTTETSIFTTDHAVIISGLELSKTHYFRPASHVGTMSAVGIELTLAPEIVPAESGETSPVLECQKYLNAYIKFGENNDEKEVLLLQKFLKAYEGFNTVPESGIYDTVTYEAVRVFQDRYFDDILKPWGHDAPTGYVYYTTQKKINEIVCNRPFPLNADQLVEVAEFRTLIESLRANTSAETSVGELLEAEAPSFDADDLVGFEEKKEPELSSKKIGLSQVTAGDADIDIEKLLAAIEAKGKESIEPENRMSVFDSIKSAIQELAHFVYRTINETIDSLGNEMGELSN
ncbi:DUF5011 domain-containing protein [bacterium]|nr:DUF5011 domain-containing protein [bacterium]